MAMSQHNPERAALVLLNFGGPRSLEEVPSFIFEILRDPNTLQVPFPRWIQDRLARRIAERRSAEVQRQYGEIGGRSPLVPATEAIAESLRAALERAGLPLPVFVAHRYLPGHALATAREVVAAGVQTLLALPLYPHFSYATTGSSIEQFRAALSEAGFRGACQAIADYPAAPGYVDALAARLERTLQAARPDPAQTVILCSAHGLPAVYVERGDPYRGQLERSVSALRARFPQWRFVLSFQSRVGPAEWLKPYTDRIVPELAQSGVRELVFLPLSFVNDHIETLYEIGVTYCDLARKVGMRPHLVPAIENHPAFIALLAGMARDWRQDQAGVPCERLLPPEQHFARYGRWALALWLVLFVVAVLLALS
ncbi:MAG: ferrochelatase [Candidatus Lambdaproteobacteria bacterium]|nr:ferrochelatase [Candidatus Lambdaproteobacteria bacterium]